MKKTILKIEASVLTALVLCSLLGITSFSRQCDSIRDKVLRMHVIANSDSDADQQLKLRVRDAVLTAGEKIFDGSITAEEAQERLSPYIEELERAAREVILSEGFDYDVNITVQNEYFKTKVYDNCVTLPAGYYNAVRVVIGEGKGQNWWCVMFPPMCLPVAVAECEIDDVLNKSESNIVSNGEKYKLRFKIVEIYEEFVKKYK